MLDMTSSFILRHDLEQRCGWPGGEGRILPHSSTSLHLTPPPRMSRRVPRLRESLSLILCILECTNSILIYSTLLIICLLLASFSLYLHIIITGRKRQDSRWPANLDSRIQTQHRSAVYRHRRVHKFRLETL